MASTTAHLGLTKPDMTDNVSPMAFNNNFDTLDTEIDALKTDYVVASGTSGMWTYRRWASGVAECWIEVYNVSSFDVTSQWGTSTALYYGFMPSPGAYPITFINYPMVIPTWAATSLYSAPIWAAPGSGGTNTMCPKFMIMDPTYGTKASATLSIYVKGTWK